MPEVRYCPGDTVVLKPRTLGSIQPQGTGLVVAVQPETHGAVRYRIRLQGENFDRSIGKDDIDSGASSARTVEATSALQRKPGSSWIDQSTIRKRK